jgi:hypothetical protein
MISPENFLTLVINVQRVMSGEANFIPKLRLLTNPFDSAGANVDSGTEQGVHELPPLEAVCLDKAA